MSVCCMLMMHGTESRICVWFNAFQSFSYISTIHFHFFLFSLIIFQFMYNYKKTFIFLQYPFFIVFISELNTTARYICKKYILVPTILSWKGWVSSMAGLNKCHVLNFNRAVDIHYLRIWLSIASLWRMLTKHKKATTWVCYKGPASPGKVKLGLLTSLFVVFLLKEKRIFKKCKYIPSS